MATIKRTVSREYALAQIERFQKRIKFWQEWLDALKSNKPKDRPHTIKPRTCPICQTVFLPKSSASPQKSCSRKCAGRQRSIRNNNPKLKRILKIRQSNPCATLQTIANQVDRTRERVRQILTRAEKPTRHYVQKNHYYCMSCGIETPKSLCPDCKKAQLYIDVACDYCGTLNKYNATYVIWETKRHPDKRYFCNRKCNGKYVAEHFGFIAHPENIIKGKHVTPRKYDYELVWQKATETGFGVSRLSKILNISSSTISRIIRTMAKVKVDKEDSDESGKMQNRNPDATI